MPLLVGSVVRIVHWAVISPDWVPRSDARQYVDLARSIAAGDGFAARFPSGTLHPTAFRPPLYPTLLAVPTSLFGPNPLWPGRLLAILIGLGVIALTVTYARRIAGDRAGLAAGLAVAIVPSLVANDTITMTESLGLLLSLGVLLALLDDRAVLAGGLGGLLLLTRPNAYLVVAVVVVALWRSVGWRRALLALAACAVVVAPWVLRNAIVVGAPKLVTSDGFTLAAMYGPPSIRTGDFTEPTVDPWYRHAGIRDLEGDEAAWSDALTGAALDGIRSRPWVVVERAVEGAATMLELPGHRAWAAELVDGRNPRFRDATLFVFPILVVAGLAGTALSIRDRRTWPAVAIVGGFLALSLLTVSVPRLRGPFDLLMCIGVGYLATWIHDRHSVPLGPRPFPSHPRTPALFQGQGRIGPDVGTKRELGGEIGSGADPATVCRESRVRPRGEGKDTP